MKKVIDEYRGLVPPQGYVSELTKLCNCTRQTVHNALRKNAIGEKADLVRRTYRAKYENNNKKNN